MARKTYYELLGVAQDASLEEIRIAYRRAVREFHPDLNPDKAKASKRTRELNLAMEVLQDPEKRLRYDRKLERTRQRRQTFGSANRERDSNATAESSATFAVSTKVVKVKSPDREKTSSPSGRRDTSSAGHAVGETKREPLADRVEPTGETPIFQSPRRRHADDWADYLRSQLLSRPLFTLAAASGITICLLVILITVRLFIESKGSSAIDSAENVAIVEDAKAPKDKQPETTEQERVAPNETTQEDLGPIPTTEPAENDDEIETPSVAAASPSETEIRSDATPTLDDSAEPASVASDTSTVPSEPSKDIKTKVLARFSEGLVAHYPLNGNAIDFSGRGNPGRLTEVTLFADRFETHKSAFFFNGRSSRIEMDPRALPKANEDRTITVWVSPISNRNTRSIPIEWGTPKPGKSFGIMIWDGKWGIHTYGAGRDIYGGFVTKPGWQMLALTLGDRAIRLYRNGELIVEDTLRLDTESDYFTIGSLAQPFDEKAGYVFSGVIDDVRVYDRCLSEEELKELYVFERYYPIRDDALESLAPPRSPTESDPNDAVGDTNDFDKLIAKLKNEGLEVVVALDSTGSMGEELAVLQRDLKNALEKVTELVPSARYSVVSYRDVRDEYETKGLPLTSDLAELSAFLASIQAAGGGDHPEAVHAALEWAIRSSRFRTRSNKIILIIGDAPPHRSSLEQCLAWARNFHERRNGRVSTITCRSTRPMDEFVGIAESGGGEAIFLADQAELTSEIIALIFGVEHRERLQGLIRE